MNDKLLNDPITFIKTKPKKYLSFMLLMIVIILFYFLNENVMTTINIQGLVKKENIYKLVLYVPYQIVKEVVSRKLIMENIEYTYKVVNVSSELQVINQINMQEVLIEINLPDKFKVENLILDVKIIKKQEKVYQNLWKKLIERE